jgi:agmatine deiminase
MITDNQTNFVYFSSLLQSLPAYQPFWNRLEKVLKKESIPYGFITGTRDIWCRDYMPVQVSESHFVQFKFYPEYLLEPRYIRFLTLPHEINIDHPLEKQFAGLAVDGGNVVKSCRQAILTDRVFDENTAYTKAEIREKLAVSLVADRVHIIPQEPGDLSGHADGMVRFLSESDLLVSDYSTHSYSWRNKYKRALQKTGLTLIPFPAVVLDEKNKDGDYTARGCYINFAQIGNKILRPFFGLQEDLLVEKEMKMLYPGCKIIPVESNEIAQGGGVLNCITWNIKV